MYKKQVSKTEYTLTEEEGRTVKNCLLYCRHRIIRHGKQKSLPLFEYIEKLIKEFEKKPNKNIQE